MFGPKPEVLGSNTTCLGTQNLLDFADPPKKNTRFYILNPLDLYKGLEWFRPQQNTGYHKCMMDYDGMYIYILYYIIHVSLPVRVPKDNHHWLFRMTHIEPFKDSKTS